MTAITNNFAKHIGGLILASSTPGIAMPASPPAAMYLMINNTNQNLICRHKQDRKWGDTFLIKAGEEYTSFYDRSLLVICEMPVENTVYSLEAGERYSFLRSANGKIKLRKVVPNP